MSYSSYQLKLNADQKKWLQNLHDESYFQISANQESDRYRIEDKIIGVHVPEFVQSDREPYILVESYGKRCDGQLVWQYLSTYLNDKNYDWYVSFGKRYQMIRVIFLEDLKEQLIVHNECNQQLTIVIAAGIDNTYSVKIDGAFRYELSAFAFFIEKNAQLTVRYHSSLAQSFIAASFISYLNADAQFNLIVESQLSPFERFFISTYLQKPGAQAFMNIRHKGQLDERSSFNLLQHHQAPNTKSTLSMRSVLKDQSQSFYTGSIIIDPACDGVDAEQYTKHLILDKQARATTIPSLEVKSAQVQCRHGSAIGHIDKDALWYMQTRGIDAQRAGLLITDAFLSY